MPPQDAYLESKVLTADPLELVRMLYRAARDATRSASAHLAAGNIAERSRQISKVHAILSQLSVSLDHARGGALSRRLAELYDYMQRQLLEANLRQKPEPLAEVERVLATLQEGWEQAGGEQPAGRQEKPAAEPLGEGFEYGKYPAARMLGAEPVVEYCAQSWSF